MIHTLTIIVDSEANVQDTGFIVMRSGPSMTELTNREFAEPNCTLERAVGVTRQFMETCRSRRRHAESELGRIDR